ncbi:MAG: large subunit ribosomal protein [Patescibacteria group bacterium]|nr:large subunit ribosomal protein [Patescibacteria group bacterium]
MNVRKGDTVLIQKGKDKGKSGKILKVLPKENEVIVEGLNLVKKIKRAKTEAEKNESILVPRPISRANVMLICPHCKKATRIGFQIQNGKKMRVCKKCGVSFS